MELGMVGRGEHAEITVVRRQDRRFRAVGQHDRPVPGRRADQSKPFRYSARTWELSRRKSISPHDALGSNLIVQVKHDRVMRVLPLENEAVNECWLSDRDRFSYEGFNADDRLTRPMLKQDGDWQRSRLAAGAGIRRARRCSASRREHGADAIGALGVAARSTLEELYLLQQAGARPRLGERRLPPAPVRFLRSTAARGRPGSACRSRSFDPLDRVLVVGSFLRKDHPLLASALRQARKRRRRSQRAARDRRRSADAGRATS